MAHAPKFRTDRSADKAKSVAAGFGVDQVLDALSSGSFPQFAPQVVVLKNETTTNQTANLILEDGSSFPVVLSGGERYRVTTPVKTVQATTGDNISFEAYWWDIPQLDEMQYRPNRGAA